VLGQVQDEAGRESQGLALTSAMKDVFIANVAIQATQTVAV